MAGGNPGWTKHNGALEFPITVHHCSAPSVEPDVAEKLPVTLPLLSLLLLGDFYSPAHTTRHLRWKFEVKAVQMLATIQQVSL